MTNAESPRRRRVLLDENLPRQLAGELPDHDVSTVGRQGWRGVLNGELLRRAEAAGYEVFVTGVTAIWSISRLLLDGLSVLWSCFRGASRWSTWFHSRPALREAVAAVQAGELVHVRPLS